MNKRFSIVALLLMAVLVLTVGCGGSGAAWKDGTYQGTGEGKGGDIVVEVTVDGGKIQEVEVVEHDETEGFCEEPIDKVPKQIIANNEPKADIVSGATLTSEGIIAAVEDALKDAAE